MSILEIVLLIAIGLAVGGYITWLMFKTFSKKNKKKTKKQDEEESEEIIEHE